MKLNNFELGSIAGAFTTICASITLERAGVMLGILTGLLTFYLNWAYMRRKDAREQRQAELLELESKARLAALGLKP